MNPEGLLRQGLAAQQAGRLAEAEACYGEVLAAFPGQFDANHLLGVLRLNQGRCGEALVLIGRALKTRPDAAEAHAHRALVLHQMGRPAEALAGLETALALKPDQPEALNSKGMVLTALGRAGEALGALDAALALDPSYAQCWNNRGIALRELERPQEAKDSFAQAARLAPDRPPILFNLGLACRATGDLDAAIAAFQAILKDHPRDPPTLNNLALALCEAGRTGEAMAHFARYAELAPARAAGSEPGHKRRHDQEQKDYVAAHGLAPQAGARLAGPAVNPDNDIAAIAERWRTATPQVVVIDNLLTPEALEALRRFCHQAPVWKKSYGEGYLGALPEEGFCCPLLAQIADELRQTYQPVFGPHALRYLWAFKCDSNLKGVNIHADFAAVNVNFWITPDKANRDPESGGLVIWDKAAPLDWDFTRYNRDEAAIRAFLAESGAVSQTVPYRANRAVIFDSDLFHQTDAICFRQGYENRRINITMLYGRRRRHEGRAQT